MKLLPIATCVLFTALLGTAFSENTADVLNRYTTFVLFILSK